MGLRGITPPLNFMKKYIERFANWQEDLFFWWRLSLARCCLTSVSNFISPQQRWVIKGIYHDWIDKSELILDVLYRSIVHFVEEEKCFQTIEWDANEHDKECAAFIRKTYKWIKVERPILVQKIDKIIAEGSCLHIQNKTNLVFDSTKSYEETYPGLPELEAELETKDQEHLTLIVKWRRHLWT